uniref:Uncharacterized protein n=1 Tax=Timema cristinae TaxID=61476 RepID=A0A7R9CW62_TIMCR|nr:unnamed protein product [Timema cristinae]
MRGSPTHLETSVAAGLELSGIWSVNKSLRRLLSVQKMRLGTTSEEPADSERKELVNWPPVFHATTMMSVFAETTCISPNSTRATGQKLCRCKHEDDDEDDDECSSKCAEDSHFDLSCVGSSTAGRMSHFDKCHLIDSMVI